MSRENPYLHSTVTRRGAPVRNLRQQGAVLNGEIQARYQQTWHPMQWFADGRLRRDQMHGSDLIPPQST